MRTKPSFAASLKWDRLRATWQQQTSFWPRIFALHTPLPSPPGIQGMNDVITACRAAFEHLDVTVEDMVAEGDLVAARFTARGVHKGAFMGFEPAGKSVTMTGIEIFRIENGKIAELWGEANLLGVMGQLGGKD